MSEKTTFWTTRHKWLAAIALIIVVLLSFPNNIDRSLTGNITDATQSNTHSNQAPLDQMQSALQLTEEVLGYFNQQTALNSLQLELNAKQVQLNNQIPNLQTQLDAMSIELAEEIKMAQQPPAHIPEDPNNTISPPSHNIPSINYHPNIDRNTAMQDCSLREGMILSRMPGCIAGTPPEECRATYACTNIQNPTALPIPLPTQAQPLPNNKKPTAHITAEGYADNYFTIPSGQTIRFSRKLKGNAVDTRWRWPKEGLDCMETQPNYFLDCTTLEPGFYAVYFLMEYNNYNNSTLSNALTFSIVDPHQEIVAEIDPPPETTLPITPQPPEHLPIPMPEPTPENTPPTSPNTKYPVGTTHETAKKSCSLQGGQLLSATPMCTEDTPPNECTTTYTCTNIQYPLPNFSNPTPVTLPDPESPINDNQLPPYLPGDSPPINTDPPLEDIIWNPSIPPMENPNDTPPLENKDDTLPPFEDMISDPSIPPMQKPTDNPPTIDDTISNQSTPPLENPEETKEITPSPKKARSWLDFLLGR